MSISAIARALGVSWHVVNAIASAAVETMVYSDTQHLEGIRVLGWMSTNGNIRTGQVSHQIS